MKRRCLPCQGWIGQGGMESRLAFPAANKTT